MSSLLEITPSTIVARLATGNLKACTPAEILALLGIAGTPVSGPVSSTDNALARFDLATGTIIQNSVAILTDAGALSGITSLVMGGALSGITTLGMSGDLTVGGTVDSRDIAADGAILDAIEPGADITDEANVTTALSGATPGVVTPTVSDSLFLQDATDSNALKLATVQTIVDLAGGGGAVTNLLYNGNFNIWQRGTTFTGIVDAYGPDRWAWRDVGAGVVDLLRSTDVPDGLSVYSCHIDVTTADASLAATDFYGLEYRIEGFDSIPLGFGTADATSVAISFWVKSTKTGIHSVALQNSAVNRSYVAEYTVDVTDTWEKKSVVIAGDTSGTWLKDTGIGVAVIFALAAGTNFTGTAGAWNAADDKASTNQVNSMDNAANNFRLAQVQLEVGNIASDFATRPFTDEYRLCKRYFQKTFPLDVTPATGTGQEGTLSYRALFAGTNPYQFLMELDTEMRLDPGGGTVTFYNPVNANTNWYNYSDVGDSGTPSGLSTASNAKRVYIANPQVATDGAHEFLALHVTLDIEL